MIRTDAQLSVSRFAELIGVPRRTYHYRLARHRAGEPLGVWPAPVLERIEPTVAKYAEAWPAWGHRKVWALARADGHDVGSQASVARAMRRRGLLQPVNYQAERRQLAQARRAVFVDPPARRNRVWQFDFSEFETNAGGIWRLGGTVDYHAKVALACPVSATSTAGDMIAALDAAEAAAEALLGEPLVAAWFARRPQFTHVRTRHRSPGTNGVIERFFEALKYEHLYRHDIDDGVALADHVDDFLDTYNRIRPHEALDWARPIETYLTPPTNPPIPDPEQDA
jgi:transposase InsO family protein